MALSGADFTCKNNGCACCGTGFAVTSIWPLGDIDLVIDAAKGDEEYVKGMTNLKKEGRKYACIKMPNQANVPVEGYRIQKWCDKCKAVRLFDVIKTFPEMTMEEAISEADYMGDIHGTCFVCNSILKTFIEITDINGNGINCPSCKKKLTMTRWFANEKEE